MGQEYTLLAMGNHYATGDGVEQDMSEAERWLREAEAHGAEGAAQALAQLGL
jgi:TPR repeat protein